ncbi:MAG: translesion error-prone DNA polymerase V autoproteolytic subunit [Pseudomonadota bacterium]
MLEKTDVNFLAIPYYSSKVSAGFPSPADDNITGNLDLNKLLVKHEAATFFMQVKSDAMKDAGIWSGDILVVDRSLSAKHGRIVIVAIGEELLIRRLYNLRNKVLLMPENKEYEPMEINNDIESVIWGVVNYVIHKV